MSKFETMLDHYDNLNRELHEAKKLEINNVFCNTVDRVNRKSALMLEIEITAARKEMLLYVEKVLFDGQTLANRLYDMTKPANAAKL